MTTSKLKTTHEIRIAIEELESMGSNSLKEDDAIDRLLHKLYDMLVASKLEQRLSAKSNQSGAV